MGRLIFLCTLVCCFTAFPVPTTSKTSKTEMLEKELSQMRTKFNHFQNNFDQIVQRLDGQKDKNGPSTEAEKKIIEGQHKVIQGIDTLSTYVKKRTQVFALGIASLASILKKPVKQILFPHLVALLISLSIGILALAGGYMLFSKKLLRLLKDKKTIYHLMLFSIGLLVLALPYFLVSIFTSLFLDFLPWTNRPWSMTYGSLYPLNLYLMWAGFYWVSIVISPQRPSQGLLQLESTQARKAAFYLRILFVIYGLTGFSLGILDIFSPTPDSIYSLWDMVILAMIFLFSRVLSVVKEGLTTSHDHMMIVKNLKFIKWFFYTLCALWICASHLVSHFFIPLMATCAQFLLFSPMSYLLRRWHLQFLWSKRHAFPLLRTFLMSRIFRSFPKYLSWGLLAVVWLSFLKNDDPNIIASSSGWILKILTALFTGPVLNGGLIFFGAMLLVKGGDRILKYYMVDKYATESFENNFLASRLKTLITMLHTLLRILVWIPALSLILSQFEAFNLGAWVTSIGAASFGLTFGFQSIVRDFITGFFIILENNLMVGDEVEIDQRKGKVEAITIRTLKIRADNGMLLTIPFGSITVIGNKNRSFSAALLNISVGYNENIDKVQSVIEKAFAQMKKSAAMAKKITGPLEMRGINEVTSYSIVFQVRIKTLPNNQDIVRRSFNRYLKIAFDEAGIFVPSPTYPILRADPSLTNTVIDPTRL